ncbi:transmembrane protein 95 isoform X2 [Zalophus californianus]|uniref:Transmembrane protein 95 isoform X2 n=1 Tax=Zalophus californianus TaxID=9704 RepID=A0A6J2AZH4_ZALCA|nr:transmembrane protein 95 isoform X2 [Zalophus californianus]
MWTLALGGVFLATAQACVLCHLSARDLSARLAQLCSRVEVLWKDCGTSWSFPAFALEIKGSLSSLPLYWRWLQNTKLPAYTREALCAPACRGSTILYNCSTCQEFKVRCWPRKRCLPGSHDLWEAKILLLSVLVAALLLGVMSLVVESRYIEAERTSEDPDSLPASSSSKDHDESSYIEAERTSEDPDSLLASSSSKDHDESTSLGEDQPAP